MHVGTSWVIAAAEPVTSIDVTTVDAVGELDAALHATGIVLCFAEMKDSVKDKRKWFGLCTRLGERTFFATVGQTANVYRATHQAERGVWENRK